MIFSKFIINIIYLIMLFQDNKIVKERVYEIYYDKIKSLSYLESKIKNISNSYNYILNNINQPISEDLLNQSYYLMTCELLERNIVDEILRIYYKNIDVAPHSLAALLHLYITNNITKNNIEFAFLISNYVMLKKNRWFLMTYEYCHKDYKEAIKSNDLSSLIRIFYDIELIKKEKRPYLFTRDEVIKKIKNLKEELHNTYNIDKLYLFGSFAKGNNTEKSDLDFVVIFNETLIKKEKNDMIKMVKQYLSKEYNCDVDLLDFSYALNTFDKSQMEYLITLI